MTSPASPALGPLILGSGGRVGRAFRTLARAGLWPGPAPLWHSRGGAQDYAWDMLAGDAPDDARLRMVRGMIVLTGGTGGVAGPGDADPRDSAALARAAIALARREAIGPVLLCSSQAVYGRAAEPQAETADPVPANAYGAAKLAMERSVAGMPGVCCLRIGNVAGTDLVLRNAALGPVALDRLPDGTAPRRCYIGPQSLAATLLRLLEHDALPPVLNLAAPGLLGMDALLTAGGARWHWQTAPAGALPALELDLTLLHSISPLDPVTGTAAELIAQARAAGWRPAA